MVTVKDATFELLRAHGLTTIFGNPGSNELLFLADLPDDFRYVLGLHEGVVASMADGFSQATGGPAFVNLHAAAGTGNAMGSLTNAWYSHTPLVITAGQQVRSTIGQEVMLSNVEAASLPRPLVKWSAEPAAPSDVVRTIGQAIHIATTSPAGPVYVSVPYDDWGHESGKEARHLAGRTVRRGGELSAAQLDGLRRALDAAKNPVLVLGPDVDAAAANADAVRLAERLAAPVWVAPSSSRAPFPTGHPHFRGVLPASVRRITALLTGHDLVLVVGAPVFRYHEYEPGEYLPEHTRLLHLTCDLGEAARSPVGEAVVAEIGPALAALAEAVQHSDRPAPAPRTTAPVRPGTSTHLSPDEVFVALDDLAPEDAIYVNETTSTVTSFWDHVEMRHPRSYLFPAAGGLGFGIAAAVGAQLGRPDRRVIGIIGDGSVNYGVSALWTAARHRTPVVFIVLNNQAYGALRGFATKLAADKVPGMDIAGIDFCALAQGYGVAAHRVGDLEDFRQTLEEALGSAAPTLIEVPTLTVSPFRPAGA